MVVNIKIFDQRKKLVTLKEKRNHYNVKLLRGYGVSISLKNSKIILKNDAHDVTGESEKEEWFVNRMPYSKIIISGKGYISTEALHLLSLHNRHVILLDTYGKPITYLNPVKESNIATKYRIGQYDTFRDESKRNYLTQQITKAKIDSQIKFLESNNDNDAELSKGIEKLKKHRDAMSQNILHTEAVTSRLYFGAYSKLIPERFKFHSRNSPLRVKKDKASDVINGLLNYGYTILGGEISKFLNGIGLDAYYGFSHKNHSSFQSLVYDLMEPFRWLVDYAVLRLVTQKSRHRISKKQYSHTRNGHIIFEYDLIRVFLEVLERTFQKERPYKFRHGKQRSNGLMNCQEVTIAKLTVQSLADYCCQSSKSFLEDNR